jgi:hypothetical protein
MGVTVCLPLFGEPGRELGEGEAIQGRQLRELGAALGERLNKAGEAVDKLALDGWACRVALFDVVLTHRGVETREEAERRLRALGLNPDELMIVEDVDEDE